MFLSILGAPASGKSYFLASMTWRLRRVLPKYFAMSFSDADPISNQRLQEYESLQFLNPDRNSPVAIEKTQTHGDLYDAVLFGDQSVDFPKPFLFALSPLDAHPNFVAADRLARVLCVYDNAGESFLPGGDTATSPVTRHLALSQVLMFLFDPTQDVQFREACAGKTNDPQMKQRSERLDRERSVRQETILLEAAQRVRRYSGVAENTKHHRPLIVVVTKYDAWAPLINSQKLDSPWTNPSKAGICALDRTQIENVSKAVRELLWDLTPELVSAAEQFAEQVIYVPVSATGRSPELDKQTGEYGIRPRDIAPIWAEVPLLYALSRWMEGVIPYRNPNTAGNAEHAPLAKAPGSSMAKTGISSQAPPPMPVNGLSSSKQNNANGRSAHGRGEAT